MRQHAREHIAPGFFTASAIDWSQLPRLGDQLREATLKAVGDTPK